MNKEFLTYLFDKGRNDNLIHLIDKDKILDHYSKLECYKSDKEKVVGEYGVLDFIFDQKFIANRFRSVANDDFLMGLVLSEIIESKDLRYWISNSMLYFTSYLYAKRALIKMGVAVVDNGGSAANYIELNEKAAIDLLNSDTLGWFTDDEIWDIRCGK